MMQQRLYLRQGGKMPADWVELVSRSAEEVVFHPLGGGLEHAMPARLFDATHREVSGAVYEALRPYSASYDIDGMFGDLPGYSLGFRWNGWACPLFPRESCDRIVRAIGHGARFDQSADTYVIPRDDGSDRPGDFETYPSRAINVSGKDVKVWPIGHGSWMWDEDR